MPSMAEGDGPLTMIVGVPNEAALAPLAERMVAAMPPRAFVTLEGDLGAGKTTLVKAVAAALGIDPAEVVSPTFGLIHVHSVPRALDGECDHRPKRLVHADLYRLSGAEDLTEIGWEDATAGDCWVFVEWPSRAIEALPADRLDIAIGIDSETGRTLSLTAHGRFRFESR